MLSNSLIKSIFVKEIYKIELFKNIYIDEMITLLKSQLERLVLKIILMNKLRLGYLEEIKLNGLIFLKQIIRL